MQASSNDRARYRASRRRALALAIAALAPGAVAQTLLQTAGGGPQHKGFGTALADVGDLDGDGVSDYAIGAPQADTMPTYNAARGRAEVRSGRTGAVLHAYTGTKVNQQLGYAVAGLGDTDGDGVPDFAIASPFTNQDCSSSTGQVCTPAGYVEVHSGRSGGLIRRIDGPNPGDRYGRSLAGGFDFDGDGRGDIVIGASQDNVLAPGPGLVEVVSVGTGAVIASISGAHVGSLLGWSVAIAGDLNGDQVPELIVGAPFERSCGGAFVTGAARVYDIAGASPILIHKLGPCSVPGAAGTDAFGAAVGAAELTGDGIADLLVGAPGYSGDAGMIHQLDGVSGAPLLWLVGDDPGDQLGSAFARLGDLDRSPPEEYAVGAPRAVDAAGTVVGAVWVVRNGAAGSWTPGAAPRPVSSLPAGATVRFGGRSPALRGTVAGGSFGRALAALADRSCDDYLDLAVGSPTEGSRKSKGAVRVYSISQQPLRASTTALSVTAGGVQSYQLDAGPARAGHAYLILGSLSGNSPGSSTGLSCGALPLNLDGYTLATLAGPNQPPLRASFGALDAAGRASGGPAFMLPAGLGPALIGLVFDHAYIAIPPPGAGITFASNAVTLVLQP